MRRRRVRPEAPWRVLGADGLTSQRFALLLLGVTVGYLVVLACARAVSARWAIAGIVAVHVVFLLAPPLLSGDVFAYLQYARTGIFVPSTSTRVSLGEP